MYRYTANLLKIWKVYNYADRFNGFSTRYFFIYLILELYSKCKRQGSRLKHSVFQSI